MDPTSRPHQINSGGSSQGTRDHGTRNFTHLHRRKWHQRPCRSGFCNTRTRDQQTLYETDSIHGRIMHFDSICGRAQRISLCTADHTQHTANVCPPNKRAVMFTNNQAAIQAIRNPKHPSGQYNLVEAVRALDEAQSQGWKVHFRWIPAHIGVLGNEAADHAAKKAAGVDPNAKANAESPQEPHSPRTLTATAKSTIRRVMRNEWDLAWENCKHDRELFGLGVRPGKATLDTHVGGHRTIIGKHGCVQVRIIHGSTFTPSTRPIKTNVSVVMNLRRYSTFCSNAETGWNNDIECGQASLYALTSSALSIAR